jgi:hypothetical protein
MRTFRWLISGLSFVATVPAPVIAAQPQELTNPQWTIVPEKTLADMRGGMDLGNLVAGFAMDRVVEVNGTVVAQTRLVISNLDRLGNGGMPTISVSGPLAQVIQILGGGAVNVTIPQAAGTSTPILAQNATSPTPAAPAARPTHNSTSIANAQTSNASVVAASAAKVPVVNAPVANAPAHTAPLANAPAANALAGSSPATNTLVAAAAAPNASAAKAPVTNISSPQASNLQANATQSGAADAPVTIAGTGSVSATAGQVVLSSLPSASAIGTVVQNSLNAATIQAKTTISATLNSLSSLNALTLTNAIQQQTALGR